MTQINADTTISEWWSGSRSRPEWATFAASDDFAALVPDQLNKIIRETQSWIGIGARLDTPVRCGTDQLPKCDWPDYIPHRHYFIRRGTEVIR